MIRALAVIAALLASACDNYGSFPEFKCTERDLQSAKCMSGEYFCFPPQVLFSHNGRPYCAAPGKGGQ